MSGQSIAFALAGVLGLGMTSVQASDFDRRYLAVDQTLHGSLTGAQMVMGQAGNQQLLWTAGDEAWEATHNVGLGYIGSIIQGHDGVYRMYYEARMAGVGTATAVAYSTDGFTWTKPELNIAPDLVAHSSNNLINLASHGAMDDGKWYHNGVVYYDANAPVSERYKMAWIGDRPDGGSGGYIATSSDGLNFVTQQSPNNPAWKYKADTGHSFFYDSINNEWAMYGRIRGAPWTHSGGWTDGDLDRRGIPRHSSANWQGTWSNVGQVVVDPMDLWDYTMPTGPAAAIAAYPEGAGPDLYTPNVMMYHGQFIGMPSAFYRDPERFVGAFSSQRVTGPIYSIFMHSHDGENWAFPDLNHSVVDLDPHLRVSTHPQATSSEMEVGQMYLAPTMIEKDGQLLLYYHLRDDTHYESHAGTLPGTVWMATMRADGFASIKADEGLEGVWHTANVNVPVGARGLLVNADVAGSLKVAVLDSEGNPIANLSLADSIAFQGDETSAFMQWSAGQFEEVAGQEVQLRFVVEDGEIYSFSFTAIPEPASLMLLGTGALLMLRRRRV